MAGVAQEWTVSRVSWLTGVNMFTVLCHASHAMVREANVGNQNIARIAATFVVPTLPLIEVIWAVHQPAFVLLTDFIPKPPFALTAAITIYFVAFAVICRNEIRALKIAGALWIISSAFSLYSINFVYKIRYESGLFAEHTVIYIRSTPIEQVTRVVDRGGVGYYARIDPDGMDTVVPINKALFDRWKSVAAHTFNSLGKNSFPDCKINLTVQRALDKSERIADHRLFTDRDIVSTC